MYPYIGTALGQAGNLLQGGGPSYYPGQEVAGFSQPQQTAMGAIDDLANSGTGVGNQGNDYVGALLGGNYSGPQAALATMGQGGATNPYLDQTFQQAAGAVQNQLQSEYGQAGRNVSASEPMMGQTLDNLATQIYGGAYNQDQSNALAANEALGAEQQNALGMVPTLNNMQFGNLGQELNVGGMVQNQAQDLMNASQNAYNYSQQQPWQNMSLYESLLSGLQPGQASSSPLYSNPAANAAGLASLASSLAELF
jgi:hypothetical protein